MKMLAAVAAGVTLGLAIAITVGWHAANRLLRGLL